MLTIKKVPTLVSNYQEDQNSDGNNQQGTTANVEARGCCRNCMGNCCLPVSQLPLYAFKENENDLDKKSAHSCSEVSPMCFLNNLLLGQWEDRMRRGLFRYDVTECETKVIPGRYGFIAQLNEGRHLKKRPTEFRVDQVLQPFDEKKFNFTKIGQEEVLFRFEPSNDGKSLFFPSHPVDDSSSSPSIVAINVSPIEYGHVLLIPRVLDRLPQRIDHESFLLALYFAKEAADPFFRVGYNGLGAFATINHLHFQAYYLSVTFPVEKAPISKIMSRKGMHGTEIVVSELQDYPVRGLVFEGGSMPRDLSDAVASSCICLQQNNIPFNVLITDCGRKVFLLPQCYAERQALGEVSEEVMETQVNPAVWEISGHMVLKRRKDYDDASEGCAWKLLSEVSLPEARFDKVKAYVSKSAGAQVEADDHSLDVHTQLDIQLKTNILDDKEGPYDSQTLPIGSHMHQNCLVTSSLASPL